MFNYEKVAIKEDKKGSLTLSSTSKKSNWLDCYGLLLVILALMAIVMLISKEVALDIKYDRSLISSGEWWRLFTGHFQHLSWEHLILNSIGLVFVWLLVGDSHTPNQWLSVFIILSFALSIAFLFVYPELKWYVGMSGIIHGLLVSGLMVVFIRIRELFSILLLLVIAGKISYEQYHGTSDYLVEIIGGQVVTEAHMIGALVGIFTGLVIGFIQPEKSIMI
jgi:rhomboid family GlyGly-CTERM serine protease